MTKDHEHEERRLLSRLRRRRASSSSTPASNLFTARATDARPVPPPTEPPPERLFDGVDRWDAPGDDAPQDDPLFSEAELDGSARADRPLAPPPPGPTPPIGPDTVPSLPATPPADTASDQHETDEVSELFATPEPVVAPPPGPDPLPAPVEFWATPSTTTSATTTGEPVVDAAPTSPETLDAATPPIADTPIESAPPEPGISSLDQAPPPTAPPAPPPAVPSAPASQDQAPPPPVEPPPPPPAASLSDSVAPLDPLADLVQTEQDPDHDVEQLADLTDELHRYAAEEPTPDEEPATGLWSHLAAPYERSADAEGAPADAPRPNLFDEPTRPSPTADEPSPLLDQVAAEFGDPRAELHRMVADDPADLTEAVTTPTPPPPAPVDLPMTGPAPDAVAPVEEPAVASFPVPPLEDDEEAAAAFEEPEPWVSPAASDAPAPAEPADPEVPEAPPAPAPTASAAADAVPLGAEPATHGPSTIRVHDDRLDNRPGPIKMSPSEAVALASDGPDALNRRRKRT